MGGTWKNTGVRRKKDGSARLNDEKKSVRRLSTEKWDEKKEGDPFRECPQGRKNGGENDKREDGLSKRQAVTQDGQCDSCPAGERRAPGLSDQKTGNRGQHREDPRRQKARPGKETCRRRNNRTGWEMVYCKERVTKHAY